MTGSPALMPGVPTGAQGVAREQTTSDDGDGAIGSATEDTSFRDLLSELEGGEVPRRTLLEPELVVRASTAPPRPPRR